MMFIFVVLVALIKIAEQQSLMRALTQTSPEYFPYHAYVVSDINCLGALISINFVVVNAVCIKTRTSAKVYLGTKTDPYYWYNSNNGQLIRSSELIIHPDFLERSPDKLLISNIGLIKLRDPAKITSTVRPISLPTTVDFPLRPGTLLNVTGYMDSLLVSNTLHYMTVRVSPQQDCDQLHGKYLLKDEERCVESIGNNLDWPGAFTLNGKLIGLARVRSRKITCVVRIPSCGTRDVFLNIESYLDWIYDNTDVPRYEKPRVIKLILPTQLVKPKTEIFQTTTPKKGAER